MLCALDRRHFLKQGSQALAGLGVGGMYLAPDTAAGAPAQAERKETLFKMSLAEWSLHRTLFAGQLNNLDFIRVTKQDYGIDAVEYVNQFFMEKAKDRQYLAEMNRRAGDLGVKQVLIMVDNAGNLGDADEAKEELGFARECFLGLRDLYQRTVQRRCLMIYERL